MAIKITQAPLVIYVALESEQFLFGLLWRDSDIPAEEEPLRGRSVKRQLHVIIPSQFIRRPGSGREDILEGAFLRPAEMRLKGSNKPDEAPINSDAEVCLARAIMHEEAGKVGFVGHRVVDEGCNVREEH